MTTTSLSSVRLVVREVLGLVGLPRVSGHGWLRDGDTIVVFTLSYVLVVVRGEDEGDMVDTPETVTTLTGVLLSVGPWVIVGRRRSIVRGQVQQRMYVGKYDSDGDDEPTRLLFSRAMVTGFFAKPTVVGSLTSLVTRFS